MHRLSRFPLSIRDIISLAASPRLAFASVGSMLSTRRSYLRGWVNAKIDDLDEVSHPAEHLSATLERLGEHLRVLVLHQNSVEATIGVSDDRALQAIILLTEMTASRRLLLDGETPLQLNNVEYAKKIANSKYITIKYFDKHHVKNTISIEIFRWRDNFRWLSSNDKNTTLRAIYDRSFFSIPGISTSSEILCGLTMETVEEEIDVVFTWVNHADPAWQNLYNKYAPIEKRILDSHSISRFHNKDELKYSLRSIYINAPWVRNIFIFSNCSPPDWLDIESRKVIWVYHSDIIPNEYLPTFNSHVIESFIHRIHGLSDNFIYFNDDFYICSPVFKEDFLTSNGCTKSFMEDYGVVYGESDSSSPDYLNAARNSAKLLRNLFGVVPTRLHKHVPYVLNRKLIFDIEEQFATAFSEFRGNRFRGIDDINVPSFLYHGYAYLKRCAVRSDIRSALVKSNAPLSLQHLRHPERLSVICVNDGAGRTVFGWDKKVAEFHERAFCEKAPWEL